jgi:predicted house-cleaning noncanonical NTP pyrophosphatase (MazG superfamily)
MAAVMDGLRARGLVDPTGRFTEQGRATKERIEELTDRLAEAPYEVLTASELEELVGLLEPISARVRAATER